MKPVIVLIGVLTILSGAWPLVKNIEYIPAYLQIIPAEGASYQGIIILIGILAILYGAKQERVRRE
ncbi:MAG: hypothetical protein AABW49_01960 [Nanoarchaeota archaeon]